MKYIKISHAQRGKKKMVTVIVGMKTFGRFFRSYNGATILEGLCGVKLNK